jgi:TolB-like protein/predicted Ser/Thr protein kinase
LAIRCPKCLSHNTDSARFCSNCAEPLTGSQSGGYSTTRTVQQSLKYVVTETILAGKYRIEEAVGRGGMGIVFRGYDLKLERTVALKFLPEDLAEDPEAKERFIREAKAAAALSHPHICTVHEIAEERDQTFIVMEFIEGNPLSRKILGGPLDQAEALDIAIQVAQGLEEAHGKGIIHRDVKPGNIMLTEKGTAKVMDFGLAKVTGRSLITKEAKTMGTVAYMSPEQAEGGAVDLRTDIWSLGVVLYEMLTGRLPFKGERDQSLVHSILNHDPEPMTRLRPNLPKTLEDVVFKALAKRAENRYRNMGEFISDLKSVAAGVKPARAKGQLLRGKIFGLKKTQVLGGGAGFVVIVAIIFLVMALRRPYDSIAVLPLRNLSDETQQDYFAEGVHEALITELSRIKSIKVISRTSVMGYAATMKKIPEIARELGGVKAIVEGSTMRSGNIVRINIQLIDGRTDKHLLAENFDREYREILTLQKEVALAIAERIRASLTPQEVQILKHAKSVDPAAYDAYLQGLFVLNRVLLAKQGDLVAATQESIDYFEKALKIDPGFAPAYAGIAFAHDYRVAVLPPAEIWPNVVIALNKAMSMDDSLAEPHMMLADKAFSYDWNWATAEKEYRRALELNPNNALTHIWYGQSLICWGRKEEGLIHVDRGRELDPLTYNTLDWAISAYLLAREYDRVVALADNVISLFPDSRGTRYYRLMALDLMGKHDTAREEAKKLVAQGEDENHPYLVIPFIQAGDNGRARKAIDALAAWPPGRTKSSGIAQIYAALGEPDRAIDALEKACVDREPWVPFLRADPLLDPLRIEPRYEALLKKLKLAD